MAEHLSAAILLALADAATAGDAPSLRRLRAAVRAALEAAGGNRYHATATLGIGRATLHRWLGPGGLLEDLAAEVPAPPPGRPRKPRA
jgi:transcriptional regulator of acetoin/glycerol metabolism